MKEFQKITSRDNQKLKLLRKTRDGKTDRRIFIEGIRLTEEALRSKLNLTEIYIEENFGRTARERNLLERLIEKTRAIAQLSATVFQTVADTEHSQGIIVVAEKPSGNAQTIESRLISKKAGENEGLKLVIFLNEVNNPSNLGAILRSAEAVDVSGVIVSEKSADVFSAKSIRAAMGANFRLPIWENASFEDVLSWAKENKLISTAADINAEKSYAKIDWKQPRLLIFGSEAHGLSESFRNQIDELAFIPMANQVESLNLAVSCAVMMFEAKRQNES